LGWLAIERACLSLFPFLPYVSFVEDVEIFWDFENPNPIRVNPVTEAGGVGIRLVNKGAAWCVCVCPRVLRVLRSSVTVQNSDVVDQIYIYLWGEVIMTPAAPTSPRLECSQMLIL